MNNIILPKKNSIIIDFETLSKDPKTCAVVSCAVLEFDESKFISDTPYTFESLFFHTGFIKFDVADQVKNYGRKITKETLDWWNNQGEDAKKMIQPSKMDQPITEFFKFLKNNCNIGSFHCVYVRGVAFDSIIVDELCKICSIQTPFHWGKYRDTRSFITGLSYGMNIEHNFMIDELKSIISLHDPRHDVILDVLRMQFLIRGMFIQN